MKANAMHIKAPSDVNVATVREQVSDGLQAAGERGRKLVLAYVGLWAFVYDRFVGLYQEGAKLLEDAVRRGEVMEESLSRRIGSIEKSASTRLVAVQDRFGENVEQMTRSVTESGESLEGRLEQQVERALINLGIPTRDRLDRLNQEIDRLSAKLDEELARQEKVHA